MASVGMTLGVAITAEVHLYGHIVRDGELPGIGLRHRGLTYALKPVDA